MKRALLLLLFIQFLGFYPAPVLAVKNDLKTVRVGIYDNSPKIYRDERGNIKGFWADIVNYIAKKEKWKLTYVFGTWEQGLKRLEKNEIDLMVDVAISKERKQKYDFNNETALITWGIFYTKKGVELNSFMDLQGKNIAVMRSGILYSGSGGLADILSSFGISANIINVEVYGDVFKLLDSGQADVGVVNWFYGIANEGQYKVNRTGIMFQPTDLKFALTKNSPQNSYLINVLDYHLREIKQDKNSVYYQALNENFGKYRNITNRNFISLVCIIGISLIFQLIAAFGAIRLISITKKYIAWTLIAIAMLLQVATRAIPLYMLLTGDSSVSWNPLDEIIGLVLSILMAVGVILISPLFLSIKRSEERLKELDKLKSKFIQIVSHQLRTPLSVIRWNIESLLTGTHFKLEEAAKESMRVSLDADIEVINRIDDLLTALDIEEGRLASLNRQSISLESLCESVMINAKKRCAVKNINCSYQPPSESLPSIEADHNKIRAVFEKIIDNAISYTGQNGEITVSLKLIKNTIRFEVADNGIGIPEAEQKNISSRFYRATNAISARPDASGLGLFIAKYFIEQHGGKMGFTSEEGKGSTFWFELPIS